MKLRLMGTQAECARLIPYGGLAVKCVSGRA